jgi:tRNA A-37 threonylcarbamoyl transferase component Bud32
VTDGSSGPGRIGNYVVERRLGSGAQADVFLARDVVLRRSVALKILHPSGDDAANLRAVEEARLIATLDHPGIVRVHHVERVAGVWAIAMEYVDGGSLETRIQRGGAMTVDAGLRVIAAVAEALEHAHRIGVVHRDVKPQNLLLTRSGHVKLADFGLAVLRGQPGPSQPVGTPSFVAPEVWLGQPPAPASDVYALGATLLYLLGGAGPFPTARTVADIRDAHLHRAPAIASTLPPSVRALIERCLAKAPAGRFRSAAALATAAEAARAELAGERTPRPRAVGTVPPEPESRDLELAVADLPPFADARSGLAGALTAGAPVVVLAGGRREVTARVARTSIEAIASRFTVAARCRLAGEQPLLAAAVARALHIAASSGPRWSDAVLAAVQPAAPVAQHAILEVELDRALTLGEIHDLRHLARCAEGRAVHVVVTCQPALADQVVTAFAGAGLGYLVRVVHIADQTAAHVREHALLWTRHCTDGRVAWTPDALALIAHLVLAEGCDLARLLHNAVAIARAARMPLVTSWCVTGGAAHPEPLTGPADIAEDWRSPPRTWPSPAALEALRRARLA